MSTEIYLGNPPENIKKWIEENYKPAFKLTDPLCFTAEEAGSTVTMLIKGSAPTVYLETSPTGEEGSWTDFIAGTTTITLANVGDKVYFRAKQDYQLFATNPANYNYFVMTGKIAASGNLNTLLKADGDILDLTGANYCYASMFSGCTSLTKAPALPATTLANGCYYRMFINCSSLTKAPELPATTLAEYCYTYMFVGCTSLTQAPVLPATTLVENCYNNMFESCTSLIKASELSATTLAKYCCQYMFAGCTSLTQAPELPATTLANSCYRQMFINCSSLTKAPELPATTLASYCYSQMFYGCSKLNHINVNFSAWDPLNATENWVSNISSSSGTFTCPADLPETYGISNIPTGWTVVRK